MPQNNIFLQAKARRNLAAAAVIKNKPGTLVSVVCLTPGTINIINDVTVGGGGAALGGFPATMTAGQVLTLNEVANVGISASAVTGSYNIVFS